jgi:CheY-like chemotaxis protein
MSEEVTGGVPPTVLVVDDNDELRALLRAWLAQHGCRVVEASDGPAAVRVAAGERPDLILMDLHMPEMDGFAAAYRIRLLAKLGPDVPIVAISADAELGSEAQKPTSDAAAVGFDGFAPKPFSPGQLEDLLTRYLPKGGDTSDGSR